MSATPTPASESRARLGATYDAKFYESLDARVRDSAATVVPIVVDLLRPASVLDVGCGRGTWLSAFVRCGVTDIVGVDGPHHSPGDLEIPPDTFVGRDLTHPLDLGRRFDLASSLEVAEHLPAEFAAAFVASLVAHAPVVLFSAAIPFQGGADHVNEQWQSYWAALFADHGYVPVDAVRPRVWGDARVAYYYAQNILLYVDAQHPDLGALRANAATGAWPLDVVHPGLLERTRSGPAAAPSLRRALRDVRGAAWRAVRRRVPPRG
jgi:SAM-dependent methyltransferase